MELIVVGPLEPALAYPDAWCQGQRLRFDSKRNELVWTLGTCKLVKRLGLSKPPSSAPIFAQFEGELCACAFLAPNRILVCSQSGWEWEVALPFAAKKMWACCHGWGVLVERFAHPSLVGEPFLFSISHPLEEAKPVLFEGGMQRKLQQVVWVSGHADAPLVLLCAVNDKSHTLWRVSRHRPPTTVTHQGDSVMAMETDGEDEIHPEVEFSLVRKVEEFNLPLDKCFLCHQAAGRLVLCAVLGGRVVGFGLGEGDAGFEILNVLDASPVDNCTEPGVLDLLVLRPHNKLELHRAGTLLCPIPFASAQRQVVGLEGGLDGALDLVFAGDKSRSRVVLNVHVSAPSVLSVLRAARESDHGFGLWLLVSVVRCGGSSEWDALLLILQQLLGPQAAAAEEEEEESWFDLLLSSSVHLKYQDVDGLFSKPVRATSGAPPTSAALPFALFSMTNQTWSKFFASLHLVYQNLKLDVLCHDLLLPVAQLLGGLARALLPPDACLAYQDAYARDLTNPCFVPFAGSTVAAVDACVLPPPDIVDALAQALRGTDELAAVEWTGTAGKYFRVFAQLAQHGDEAAIERMVDEGITLKEIDTLPFGVQMVVREVLHRAKERPTPGLSHPTSVLIGRQDCYLSNHPCDPAPGAATAARGEEDEDELKALLRATRLRFPQDHRVKDVFHLLDGARPPLVFCERKPGMSDHDLIQVQQVRLRRLLSGSLASAVGRGAMLLSTRATAPGAQHSDKPVLQSVPVLAKCGVVPPQNVSLSLDERHQLSYSWPAFHNGVASALGTSSHHHRLVGRGDEATAALAHRDWMRSWILFNKPKSKDAYALDTHAGVLLAWGLNGDLAALSLADTYEHLETPHELTSIAILLGLGASKPGTCDGNVRKTLTLHVPALFPVEFSEIDVVPATVQCAALCGLGLLYRGTCNRLMCEFLLEEMSHSLPTSDAGVEHQGAYCVSAGLALGHVALGLGAVPGGLAGLADLEVEDRLHLLIAGGPAIEALQFSSSQHHQQQADMNDLFASSAFSSSSTGSGVGVGGAAGGVTGGNHKPRLSSPESKCARVLEGKHVNTDVTAPGATLALGLVYLKSNDHSVANRLAAPATRYLLENIRPDLLLYRVWAKSLVLWDEVQPSLVWIQSHVPPVVAASTGDVQDAKYFGQVRMYILSGACLGMGFRFVGTGSTPARDCLLGLFYAQLDSEPQPVLLSCICTALGLIMAGTGDLDSLKAVRAFTKSRLTRPFGLAQLASQSLGFLFLGAGKRSFNSKNESIAALVHAVFPKTCLSVEDNTQYLQALRHLYVLATECRVVETFDLETGQECFTPLVVTMRTNGDAQVCTPNVDGWLGDFTSTAKPVLLGNQIYVVAPALLPPSDTVQSIAVVSPRYWPLKVDAFTHRLVVQLRADQLPYQRDAQGFSCLRARPRPRAVGDLLGVLRDFAMRSPVLLALAKHHPSSYESLYQCMLTDSLSSLPCQLELAGVRSHSITALEAEQWCLLRAYYRQSAPSALLGGMAGVDLELDRHGLAEYVATGEFPQDDGTFPAALNLRGIPKLGKLRALIQSGDLTSALPEEAVVDLFDL